MKRLSQALEDYLETILLLEKNDKPITVSFIAKKMGVSKPACVKAMKRLLKRKLIKQEKYGTIFLTYEGRLRAKDIYGRHTIIKKFLISIGVSESIAENDCCNIEHVISHQTLRALEKNTKK